MAVATGTAIALMAATTAASAYGSIQAGKAQKAQFKAQADQADRDARTQTIERKRALIETLATQNVGAASQGRTISSIASLQQEDVRRAGYDETLIKGGAAAQRSSLEAAGKSAMQSAYLNAGTSLLSGASQMASLSAPKKG